MANFPAQHQDADPGLEHEMNPRPDYAPRFPGAGRLAGKAAIITGGDSGIGRATAVAFAREGADVAIVYLDEDRDAEETKALIEAEGTRALLVKGNVRQKAFCTKAVEEAAKAFGRLDILVNNAAHQEIAEDVREISEEQLAKTFETNIYAYFYMTQAALDHLKPGASIVNVTSVNSYKGNEKLIDYSSTKGAITAFTRSMASNLVEKGIRVNGVAPGPIWTPFIPMSFPADKVAEFGSEVPMKRAGQPNEVASALLFLASDDASYFTGQVLHPNGGMIVGA
ncbi:MULTISPECIES: SDR family oxidoreductase [unclassified Aureimonas]|uniref:SDR family oxidoreductase n=1 Tax=unclassified Aureimonas TaxID=2615206 RepID=UPI0006FA3692|nr:MULTISPECIES: SDR family oxidoreductase [unclassified Aureimonas]KQT64325.1 NAD(P)-dependent oxidoreductase [Aureimonas sp. Leaf427]KQT81514.1 NAD(P)-dependent oxidoreductase [Aureimonas sp. Leaf460]